MLTKNRTYFSTTQSRRRFVYTLLVLSIVVLNISLAIWQSNVPSEEGGGVFGGNMFVLVAFGQGVGSYVVAMILIFTGALEKIDQWIKCPG